jgi:hypothetical protein
MVCFWYVIVNTLHEGGNNNKNNNNFFRETLEFRQTPLGKLRHNALTIGCFGLT